LKYRRLSAESLAKLKAKIGAALSFKANNLLATSHTITIRNIETNITKE
jgi:hypothetical protein